MDRRPEEKHSLFRECQAILTVYLVQLIGGIGLGYSTVAILGIQQGANSTTNHTSIIQDVEASEEDLSWFAGGFPLGSFLGSFPAGVLGAKFGPKKIILISSIPGILGWILIATAPHLASLIIGRVLCGLAHSFMVVNAPALVVQYSSKNRRGSFLTISKLNESFGITLVYSLGLCVPWRFLCVVPVLIYVISVLGLLIIPESPIWILVNKGREEAEESLRWLRRREDVDNELLELDMLKEKQKKKMGMSLALKNLSRPDIHRPFLLIFCVCFGSILMGRVYFVYYAAQIFKKAGMLGNPLLPAILTGVVQFVGFLAGLFLIPRLKRTTLASIVSLTSCFTMGVLGVCLYLKSLGQESPVLEHLPVVCVSLYLFLFACGIASTRVVYLGEIMPPEYNVLTGLLIMVLTFSMFITVKSYPILSILLQPHGLYWLISGICLLMTIFFLFVMPETKGKSMVEIRQLFIKKSPTIQEDSKKDSLLLQTEENSCNTKC